MPGHAHINKICWCSPSIKNRVFLNLSLATARVLWRTLLPAIGPALFWKGEWSPWQGCGGIRWTNRFFPVSGGSASLAGRNLLLVVSSRRPSRSSPRYSIVKDMYFYHLTFWFVKINLLIRLFLSSNLSIILCKGNKERLTEWKIFFKWLPRRQFISAGGISLDDLAVWNENPSKLGIGDLFNTTSVNMTMADGKVVYQA